MANDQYRDEAFEVENATENEDDIHISAEQFSDLIVAPSDWTIGTIYQQLEKQVDLDPAFQRRNVWSAIAKSKFIESLLLGIPIPQILLSVKKGKKGSYIVLDGKQRLLTISEFIKGKTPDGKEFRLKGMRILKELEGMSWSDIKKDEDRKDQFWNETVRTTIIKNWSNQNVLYEIFYRLNSGSVKLSPMELRMALYPGEFLKWIISWSETLGPLHELLRKKRPDPRMADVEIAVRFLAFELSEGDYTGNLKEYLDVFCDATNAKFGMQKDEVAEKLSTLNKSITLGMDVFPNNTFCRKYLGDKYEGRFNRAILDVMLGSMANIRFYNYMKENPIKVRKAFEKMCVDNSDFIRSVETSTKNIGPTRTRFSAWYEVINAEFGISIPMPKIRA